MGILLNPELEKRIAEKVQRGGYKSADKLIEKSLRVLDETETVQLPEGETDLCSLWESLAEISRSVPDEEWAKLPPDLSINHDHYLYGTPKVEE